MEHAWFKDELATADFADQRLNKRSHDILAAFAARPNGSIPLALGGRNELEAAYRFFNNKKVTPERILAPHNHTTAQRCAHQKIVLCPQDTSELDFSRPEQQVAGAGPLDGSERRGAFLHLIEAFTEDGTPLGALGAKFWAREEPDPDQPKLSRSEKAKKRRSLPFEQKESVRWLEGFRLTQKVAKSHSETMFVSLCDSEGDMYELLVEPRKPKNFHWIVRACHDRKVLDLQGDTAATLRASLLQRPVLFSNEITVRGRKQKISCETRSRRKSRSDRQATVEVRAGTVTIQAPAGYKGLTRSVLVNVVLVHEPNPPAGEEAIEWILLTTLRFLLSKKFWRSFVTILFVG